MTLISSEKYLRKLKKARQKLLAALALGNYKKARKLEKKVMQLIFKSKK